MLLEETSMPDSVEQEKQENSVVHKERQESTGKLVKCQISYHPGLQQYCLLQDPWALWI